MRSFGIYEKALPSGAWPEMLASARRAGFDFVEMSIDESDARLARLAWSRSQRRHLARACVERDVPVFSICLSAHRRFGLGSADPEVRDRALEILDDAIALACDLGVRVIQIAGYHAYYEVPDSAARIRYIQALRRGTALATRRGVMLALENIDTEDMASMADCVAVCEEIDSPWLRVYPDVGNFVVNGLRVASELEGLGRLAVGLHLKDARLGEPRRVPFGEGAVPFDEVFAAIVRERYEGPLTIEMWNDDTASALRSATDALNWITHGIIESGPALTTNHQPNGHTREEECAS